MKKLLKQIRRTTVLVIAIILTFAISLLVTGAICNLDKITRIYKEFYGTWSWDMVICLVLSGLIAGMSITYLLVKSAKNKE